MKEDKNKIEITLRAFKLGHITFDEATDYILKFYSSSKRFNWNSFYWGGLVACLIMFIVKHFL